VDPSKKVLPGSMVRVSYKGFPTGAAVKVRQCKPDAVSADDCDPFSEVTDDSNENGSGSTEFQLRELPDASAPGRITCNSETPCDIVVASDFSVWSSNVAGQPITLTGEATKLKAAPVVAQLLPSLRIFYPNVNATLTVAKTGVALPKQKVRFTLGRRGLCSTATDDSGVATCSGNVPLRALINFGGYTATFAGDEDYGPSRSTVAGSINFVVPVPQG
ncbi:MAG: hypothetical protein ACRDRT_16405, partial [Pseudonocardiaceae bacterium]